MKTSIMAVGTELLFGQTVNTNAAFLSDRLNHMGFDVMYHFVVGDNPERLKEKLSEAFIDTDLVILTGGLGPTQDDLTKEMLQDINREKQLDKQKLMSELESFDLNSLFTFGINFDMLKLVINNLIKSNHRVNYKLSELKFDKINSEKRIDQLESELLELKIAKEKSQKEKSILQEKKSKILSYDYKIETEQALKEKEYYTNSLNNLNKDDTYKLDKIINNITKFKLGTESSKKSSEDLMKKLEEYNNKLSE